MELEEEILAKLSPKLRNRAKMASDVILEKQPTPSVGLNSALGGGFGYGRQSLVWGTKSAGKSTFCLGTIALGQLAGKRAAFIDSEQSFDPAWATRLGVNTSKLIYSDVKTIEDVVGTGIEFMQADVDIIVSDSISALLSSAYFEKDKKSEELKDLSGTKQIGSEARELANGVKMWNYANKNTALILISQIRNKITTYGAMHQATGGHAVDFFSSTVVKLTSSAREADQIEGEIFNGDRIIKEPVGRPVNWSIDKNKLGPPNRYGSYDLYYAGDFVGIDNIGESFDIGEKLGIITKKGSSWFTLFETQFQGRMKVIAHLRENPDILAKLREEIASR